MDSRPPGSSVHGIFQKEYWSGLPFPSPGDLFNPRIELTTPVLQQILYCEAIREDIKIPHALGQLNPRATTRKTSTLQLEKACKKTQYSQKRGKKEEVYAYRRGRRNNKEGLLRM